MGDAPSAMPGDTEVVDATATRSPRTAWWAAVAALLLACPLLYASFTSPAGNEFGTAGWALLLALCWSLGGLAILMIDRRTRTPLITQHSRRAWFPLALGVGIGLAVASLVGGLVLASWSVTAPLVTGPLAVANRQNPVVLFCVALLAGAAEEVYFRVALPRLLRGWAYWVIPTALYAAVTLVTGSLGLAAMAVILGAVALWVYSRTRAWQAPILIHALWTCAMIGIFPRIVEHFGL